MEQLKLFLVEPIVKPLEFSENDPDNVLSFDLIPALAVLGRVAINGSRVLVGDAKALSLSTEVLQAFGYRGKNRAKFEKQVMVYVTEEASKIKRNSREPYSMKNQRTPQEFLDILEKGIHAIYMRGKTIVGIGDHLRERVFQTEKETMYFSKLPRYILNGFHDRYWYEETGKLIREYFPDFDPRIICDILAATSIRASIESNTKKFFTALRQYFSEERRDVVIKQKNWNKLIKTKYYGHLDAIVAQLERIDKGEYLCEAVSEKRARKIINFSKAMFGVPNALPFDVWLTRSVGADKKHLYKGRMVSRSPSKKLYDAAFNYFSLIAEISCIELRQLGASAWSGIRGETSTSKTTTFGPLVEQKLHHGLYGSHLGKITVSKEKGVHFLPKSSSD